VTLYLPALERRPTATDRERVVLLVEDEPLARNAAKRQLKSLGFHVLEASDGREALSLYRERKGDITLVLLDLVMPKMDGEAVLDQLLKLDPEVKVLITSGYRSRDGARHLIERGAKGFLEKPYMFAELRQAIDLAEG